MKKALSLMLVLAMLLSMVAFVPVTSSAATLDKYNKATEAYYFGGDVIYKEITGSFSQQKFDYPYGDKTIKTGDAGKGTLTLDGVIDEGEWGDVNISISSADAATNRGKNAEHKEFEYPSAENSYFYYLDEHNVDPEAGMQFDAWFLWDEEFFYVAAVVYDHSSHKNNGLGEDLHKKDTFQVRIDKDGPNSVVGGTGYSAFPSTTEYPTYPWKDLERTGVEKWSNVPNIIVGYTSKNKGQTVVHDMAKKYYSSTEDDGTVVYKTSNVSYAAYIAGESGDCAAEVLSDLGPVYASAKPVKHSTKEWTTTYEMAIPWEHVSKDFVAEIGRELGITVGATDCTTKGQTLDTFSANLEWGSGIFGARNAIDPKTCGGSNSITLSGTAYNEWSACEHEFTDATCTAPKTCTKCGYQKGYSLGHKYPVTEQTVPTATSDGSAVAVCSRCGDVKDLTLAKTTDKVISSFTTSENSYKASFDADGSYTANWLDADEKAILIDTDGDGKVDGPKNAIWRKDEVRPYPNDAAQSIVNPFGYTVLDLSCLDHTGTYHAVKSVPPSLSFKFDYNFENLVDRSVEWADQGYFESIYVQFGGETPADYAIGLFHVTTEATDTEEATSAWYFAVVPDNKRVLGVTAEQFESDCIAYKKLTDEEFANYVTFSGDTIDVDNWTEIVFVLDTEAHVAMLYWDGEFVVGAYDEQFVDGGRKDTESYAIYRTFNIEGYAKDVYVGSTSHASNYVEVSAACTHENTEIIPGVPATCTEAGLTEGKKCADCGEILVEQTVVEALGHTEVEIPATGNTCIE
ncbi:MAG: hypothetical protein IJ499_00135, partial [Clostridia bacterium]|nr:hypothetical protein [Clostridia bacterium]